MQIKQIALRLFVGIGIQFSLLGCAPPPEPATVSPAPSITPSLLPVPTPAPLGTTQTIRLKNKTLAITPIEVKIHYVSSTQGLLTVYVAIKFQFDAIGPDVWRPLNSIRKEEGGVCLDLQVATDISRPLCNVLYSSPSLSFTTGPYWPCAPVFGNDVWWYQRPELSLQPLLPGDSRVGWVTWCIYDGFGSADSSAFRDGLILATYGSFSAPWAEWIIYPGQ